MPTKKHTLTLTLDPSSQPSLLLTFSGVQDASRHKADALANASQALVLDKASGKWAVKERWEVAVGDFVKVGFDFWAGRGLFSKGGFGILNIATAFFFVR